MLQISLTNDYLFVRRVQTFVFLILLFICFHQRTIIAALLYLESQHIVNVNWDKLQTISNGVLSTIATTATNATSTSAGGVGLSIPSILGNNTGAAAAILPITNTMTNLGIPLTGSTAMGFTLGLIKG